MFCGILYEERRSTSVLVRIKKEEEKEGGKMKQERSLVAAGTMTRKCWGAAGRRGRGEG